MRKKEPIRIFLKYYKKSNINLIMLETKTPVLRLHWRIIKDLKVIKPDTIIVLVGDHVTVF